MGSVPKRFLNKYNYSEACLRSPHFTVRILRYIFANSYTSVEFNGFESSSWRVSRGVRQGGVLSALLFAVYLEDILEAVNRERPGCYLGIQKMNIQAYADDIVLYCPTSSGLRELLQIFARKVNEHELVINFDKTKVMMFGRQDGSNLGMKDQNIVVVHQYKYLGTVISCSCLI